MIGEPDMTAIYYLRHKGLSNIAITIDKYPYQLPEDYMKKKIEEVMDFTMFNAVYDSIK